MGLLTTPATWQSGTFSRKRENIAESPFLVLDFDKIPTTGNFLAVVLAEIQFCTRSNPAGPVPR